MYLSYLLPSCPNISQGTYIYTALKINRTKSACVTCMVELHALLANLGLRPKPGQFVVLRSNIIQVMNSL